MKTDFSQLQKNVIDAEDRADDLQMAWVRRDTAENEKIYLDAKHDLEIARERLSEIYD